MSRITKERDGADSTKKQYVDDSKLRGLSSIFWLRNNGDDM